jgi:hypothetical protein
MFCQKWILLGLKKNLYWFRILEMLIIAIPMLCAVKMKTSWRNNFYWRTLPNSFAAFEYLAGFSLAALFSAAVLSILFVQYEFASCSNPI